MPDNNSLLMPFKQVAVICLVLSMLIPVVVISAPRASAASPSPYADDLVAEGFDINFTKELHINQTSAPTGEWKTYLYPGAWVQYTTNGMICNFNASASTTNRQVYVGQNPSYRIASDTIRAVFDLAVNNTQPTIEHFKIKWQFSNSAGATLALITTTYSPVTTLYALDNYASGSLVQSTTSLFIDNYAYSDDGMLSLDVLLSIVDGNTVIYRQNGVEWRIPIVGGELLNSHFNVLYVATSTAWTNNYTAVLKYIGLADLNDSADICYKSNLKLSSVPYGYDATLAFDIHADFSKYEMIDVAEKLASDYGIMGTLHTFVHGNTYYGQGFAENASLLNSLKEARSSGWELGTHALSSETINRTAAIEYLQEHYELLGEYPQTWADHGAMDHDLWKDGDNPASDYYISDFMNDHLTCAWLNDESIYHQDGFDVTIDGMYISLVDGIETYGASRGMFLSYLSSASTTPYMGYLSSRAVIVIHDYLTNLCVVKNGGTLIGTSAGTGVTVTPNWYINPQSNYLNNEWFLHPSVKSSLDTLTSSGKIWSAGVSEIYQYTEAVRDATIIDDVTSVQITNPSSIDLHGLTIYTLDTAEPEYALFYNGKYYAPQAAADGWNYVIDNIPRGSVVTLQKVYIPEFMPEIKLDSSGMMVWADENKTYIYAPQNGAAHVGLNYDYTDYLLRDSDGETIDYELVDGSIYWNVTRGELYEVQSYANYRQEQMDAAFSPIFAIIPLVIIMSVIPMVMGLGRKLK